MINNLIYFPTNIFESSCDNSVNEALVFFAVFID